MEEKEYEFKDYKEKQAHFKRINKESIKRKINNSM